MQLPLVTLFDSMWGNLERCHQFDDGTRQMIKLAYREALTDNAYSNLLELPKEVGLLSWNKAGEDEVTFACHLANKLEIEVLWELFNEDTIIRLLDSQHHTCTPVLKRSDNRHIWSGGMAIATAGLPISQAGR